jgi:hypothetical protein
VHPGFLASAEAKTLLNSANGCVLENCASKGSNQKVQPLTTNDHGISMLKIKCLRCLISIGKFPDPEKIVNIGTEVVPFGSFLIE